MLILIGVTVTAAINGGLFDKAKKASKGTENAKQQELNRVNDVVDMINTGVYGRLEERNLNINYTKTEGQNLPSATVSLDIKIEEEPLTLKQKRKIATFLCDFSNYKELLLAYSNYFFEIKDEDEKKILEKELNELNEEQFEEVLEEINEEELLDGIIEIGRRFIDYSDISKLESMGIKVITVKTPYNNILYTSNLGEPIKCSLNKNGTYDFTIKSGATEKTETITIDNIREASKNAPYKVTLENGNSNFLYSADGKDNWKLLKETTTVECNNAIYLAFAESPTVDTTEGEGMHYVEKNDEYYKYFNDEQPTEWEIIRRSYIFCFIAYNGRVNRKEAIRYIIMTQNGKFEGSSLEYNLAMIYSGLHTSRLINFAKDFPDGFSYKIGGKNKKFTEEMSKKYPELELGNDNVIGWTGSSGETDSPVYKLEVDHDMNIHLLLEIWD